MKIRNGFVSNSSSSSFVIAFDKKPKSVEEVQKILFGNNKTISYYNITVNTEDASRIVFEDICKSKKVNLKDIVELFKHRYHYFPTSNVSWFDREDDELGGAWLYSINRYYLSDEKLMRELRNILIDSEMKYHIFNEIYHKIMKEQCKLKEPSYAYKGGKKPNGKYYTIKEIRAYDTYLKAMKKFQQTNKDFIINETNRDKHWREVSKKTDELGFKIAKKDAKNFMDDNKGKFIIIAEYGDNSGDVHCVLEHGNVFNNVAHVRVSHH